MNGVQIFQPVGSGGGLTIGTTPITSGTTTRLLFDAAGVVSETDGATWSATNKALTVGGATVTTSNPVLDLSQTWNAGAVTFTGIKMNVTNTASAAASLLLDLQVGGVSIVNVARGGNISIPTTASYYFGAGANISQYTAGISFSTTGALCDVNMQSSRLSLADAGVFSWTSSNNAAGTSDLFMRRGAAAMLVLGAATAAPVAQTIRATGAFTNSNQAGANFTIAGSNSTGSAAGGSIIFQTSPAGGAGSSQNALVTVLTLDSTKQANFAGHMQMTEITAPAAGAANTVRIYAEDNGAGKTRLMAIFASGAAQQVAIEP